MTFSGVLYVAPRVMTPMIDFPFTRSLSFSMKIWELKPLAVLTRRAAGRACMPARLRIVTVPIKPGRNIPVIIETAARNERLKKMGYYSAREFNRNVMNWLEGESTREIFLNEK